MPEVLNMNIICMQLSGKRKITERSKPEGYKQMIKTSGREVAAKDSKDGCYIQIVLPSSKI